MEKRVLLPAARAFTSTVNDSEHMESQAMVGVGLTRCYVHPGANAQAAVAAPVPISHAAIRVLADPHRSCAARKSRKGGNITRYERWPRGGEIRLPRRPG